MSRISNILAEKLNGLEYLEKIGAESVSTLTVSIKNKDRIFPACRQVYLKGELCEPSETYKELAPNDKYKAIVYFEDLGTKRTKKLSSGELMLTTLRLVAWLQLHESCNNRIVGKTKDDIIAEIINVVSGYILEPSGIVTIESIEPPRPTPFERFTYDETRTQYLISPYDYFSLKVAISHAKSKTVC